MKKFICISFLLIFGVFFFSTCNKKNNDPAAEKARMLALAQLSKQCEDSTFSNIEMTGKFVFTHLKYYLGTNDMSTFMPKDKADHFMPAIKERINHYHGWSNDQVLADLHINNSITFNEKNYLNEYSTSINQFLQTNAAPSEDALMNFLLAEEAKVKNDNSLTYDEKYALLLHHTLVRYAVKWKFERLISDVPNKLSTGAGGRSTISASIWTTIACYIGTISSYVGISTAFGGANILAAVVGTVLGAVNAYYTCDGSNKNVCQDPLSLSLPYQCYTYGNPLTFTAVGYGNSKPAQFVFSFADNDNLNNALYSNFTGNPYIDLPGSYLTTNITDVAVQCRTSCSAGNPLWFGWYKLSDLGKPYFTLSGTSNMTVAQAAYYPSFEYDASGPIYNTNATITWQIIPSGYPNYSATGYFQGSNTGTMAFIHWNAVAGFATLACTATVNCSTITQYYTIHIQ